MDSKELGSLTWRGCISDEVGIIWGSYFFLPFTQNKSL